MAEVAVVVILPFERRDDEKSVQRSTDRSPLLCFYIHFTFTLPLPVHLLCHSLSPLMHWLLAAVAGKPETCIYIAFTCSSQLASRLALIVCKPSSRLLSFLASYCLVYYLCICEFVNLSRLSTRSLCPLHLSIECLIFCVENEPENE